MRFEVTSIAFVDTVNSVQDVVICTILIDIPKWTIKENLLLGVVGGGGEILPRVSAMLQG